jgi:ribosomal protein S18 acetylase RimI-like enzyme
MVKFRNYRDPDYNEWKLLLQKEGMFDAGWESRENMRKKIRNDPASVILAIADGKIVGNIFYIQDGWGSFLFRLVVKKGYRKKGIGTMLIREAEKRLRKKGVRETWLFTDHEKRDLIGFYRKRGFTPYNKALGMGKRL